MQGASTAEHRRAVSAAEHRHPAPADPGAPLPLPGGGEARASRMSRGIAGALLVLVTAGYFAIAADQSHSVPAARELDAEEAGLVGGTPSAVQQAVYRVPVPAQADDAAYFEANSWSRDTLYVQFRTTQAGLAGFLGSLDTSPAHLRSGLLAVTVPGGQAARVPWRFAPYHHWAGMTLSAARPHPVHEITVDLDDPQHPVVFTASVIRFAP